MFSRNLFFPEPRDPRPLSRDSARVPRVFTSTLPIFTNSKPPLRDTRRPLPVRKRVHTVHRLKLSKSLREREREIKRKRFHLWSCFLNEESRREEGCSSAREAFRAPTRRQWVDGRGGNERENRFWLAVFSRNLLPSLRFRIDPRPLLNECQPKG